MRKKDPVDELFEEAVELVLREGSGSVTLVQRAFSVGYSRAARIIQAMQQNGILGPRRGLLISLEEWSTRKKRGRRCGP